MNILIFPIRSSQKSVIFEPTRNERSDLGASLVHVFRRRHYYWATERCYCWAYSSVLHGVLRRQQCRAPLNTNQNNNNNTIWKISHFLVFSSGVEIVNTKP